MAHPQTESGISGSDAGYLLFCGHCHVLTLASDLITCKTLKMRSQVPARPSSPDSDIETLTPETSDAIPKKSWVWQYFKTFSIENVHWNIFQANKVPGSAKLCEEKLSIDK